MDFNDIKTCEREQVCRTIEDCCDWCKIQRYTNCLATEIVVRDVEQITAGCDALAEVYNRRIKGLEQASSAARRDSLVLAKTMLEMASFNLKMLSPCECPDCMARQQVEAH